MKVRLKRPFKYTLSDDEDIVFCVECVVIEGPRRGEIINVPISKENYEKLLEAASKMGWSEGERPDNYDTM